MWNNEGVHLAGNSVFDSVYKTCSSGATQKPARSSCFCGIIIFLPGVSFTSLLEVRAAAPPPPTHAFDTILSAISNQFIFLSPRELIMIFPFVMIVIMVGGAGGGGLVGGVQGG